MGRIVVTDLTRFKNPEIVCLAGLTPDGRHCIRPMRARLPNTNTNPYLSYAEYRSMKIRPGVMLEADFGASQHPPPHIEDRQYHHMKVVQDFDEKLLQSVIRASACDGISEAFGVPTENKYIPVATGVEPSRSIITLKVDPSSVSVEIDQNHKMRIHFTEKSGVDRSYLSVTDVGMFQYVDTSQDKIDSIRKLNNHFKSQEEVFMRIGITRPYQSDDGRNGYWLQVNSVFSFPDLHECIEDY